MARRPVHTHECADCTTQVPCDGERLENYDGEPEVICDLYDLYRQRGVCEDCEQRRYQAIRDEARAEGA